MSSNGILRESYLEHSLNISNVLDIYKKYDMFNMRVAQYLVNLLNRDLELNFELDIVSEDYVNIYF
jgi:hypothetical protein